MTRESINFILDRDLNIIEIEVEKNEISLIEYLKKYLISDLYSGKIEFETVAMILREESELENFIDGFEKEELCLKLKKIQKFLNRGENTLEQSFKIKNFIEKHINVLGV